MKKIYSLLFAMLLAFVGAGSAWAETYHAGQTVDLSDLNDNDILENGVTITDNVLDLGYCITYASMAEFTADISGFGGDFVWDFPYTITNEDGYIVLFNSECVVCLISNAADDNKITDVTFKLGEGQFYYATFYSEEAWEVPAKDNRDNDTEVLVITGIDGNDLSTATIARSGDIVAGGVAVLLKSATQRTVAVNKTSETPTVNYTGDNLLVGSDDEQTFDNSNYVYYILSKSNGVTGFYWQSGSNKGDKVVNGAHKASLQVPKSVAPSNALNIRFDDTVTAINSAKTQSISDTYYNMQGKRVNANSNGILIRNGHKYIAR